MIDPNDDGVTHVNIYSKGKTDLGRFLSNFSLSPIETEDGHFRSIEGYWYWLFTGDDRLRRMVGYPAKKLGREIRDKLCVDDLVFRRKIMKAMATKLLSNPRMLSALRTLNVPLDHYYVVGGRHVVRPTDNLWVLDFYQAVRKGDTCSIDCSIESKDTGTVTLDVGVISLVPE